MKKEKIVLASIEYSKSKPLAYVSGKLYLAKKRKKYKISIFATFSTTSGDNFQKNSTFFLII